MIGILLINLGTPEAPTEAAVRAFLDVFLSDPYVITLPKLLRDFLVQKIILQKRPAKTAHAYKKIWTDQGSPLLVNSLALQNALQKQLGKGYQVALGMRYSNPSIETALLSLKNCEEIIVLPLYPQFSKATTQSSLDVVNNCIKSNNITAKITLIHDFHDQDFYIQSIANKIKNNFNPETEFLLLSYHGLPKRQSDSENYKNQCDVSTQLIAKELGLNENQYQMAFQSRLGFTKWIAPYTDQAIVELRHRGIKNIAVACPSFVADCIETLEEINIRLRAQWMTLGGLSFNFVPCLNADLKWVGCIARGCAL